MEKVLEEQLRAAYEEKLLNLWVDICREYGVDYTVHKFKDGFVAKPDNEYEAMLKQYGSGTQGVPAEFWVEKAKQEFYKRMNAV